jgi:glycerophosphoryl diester phosphodiesterase
MGAVDGWLTPMRMKRLWKIIKKGSRVFEVVLMFTSDGHLVARHEWTESFTRQMQQEQAVSTKQGGKPWSYEQFKTTPIYGSYTPVDWEDALELLENYPDAYVVTDTKEQDPARVRQLFVQLTRQAQERNPNLLSRIVPQIYDEDMLRMVRSIYPYFNGKRYPQTELVICVAAMICWKRGCSHPMRTLTPFEHCHRLSIERF